MSNLSMDVKKLINDLMIPEVEAYIDELLLLLEDNRQTEEDMKNIKEMETFLVELQNINFAIEEEKLSTSQLQEVYDSIQELINDSQKH